MERRRAPRQLSTEDKLKILEEVDKNPHMKRMEIAQKLNLPPSTLSTIVSNREKIMWCVEKFSIKRKRSREGKFAHLEYAMVEWIKQIQEYDVLIDGLMIKEQACHMANLMGIEDFKASNGWIDRFKNRYAIVYSSENKEKTWFSTVSKDYKSEDVFSAKEIGIYYDLVPEDMATHQEPIGKRLTILLCCNQSGTEKLPLLVIGKHQNPRSFKNIRTLPCKYVANKNAWMTRKVFEAYLKALDTKMAAKNRNVLLLLDRSSSHPPDTERISNINIEYFPSDESDVLRPLKQGVIKEFKRNYRRHLIQKWVSLTDRSFKPKISVLDALYFAVSAWDEVEKSTIVSSFRKTKFLRRREMGEEDSQCHPLVPSDIWLRAASSEELQFDHYVSCDDDVPVCQTTADQTLYPKQRRGRGDEENDEEPSKIPSFSEAVQALDTIRNYVTSFDVGDKAVSAITKMNSVVHNVAGISSKRAKLQ
ncbi:tigger transposable element-derived protein 4-like [Centruroides vittatus]|uniref:tigger transposable element-derived protein 4-like n=1 Tax=Centruroides vittatus TaxID=120091 RepID=UPI00350F825E